MDSEKKYAAPAAGRLLDLVELLAAERGGLSLNDMARRLGVPVNTIYRIAQEMEARGYLGRLGDRGLYQLGSRFYQIGCLVGGRIDLRRQAAQILQDLRDQCGETVHLCVLQQNRLVLLDQAETSQPIRIHVEVGSLMLPHASAFGKCLLAFAPASECDLLLREPLARLTARTLTSRSRLLAELTVIRERGWALDHEEYLVGVRCLGAPVIGAGNRCLAAIGVMGPSFRLDEDRLTSLIPLVRAAADRLSAAMGRPDPVKDS